MFVKKYVRLPVSFSFIFFLFCCVFCYFLLHSELFFSDFSSKSDSFFSCVQVVKPVLWVLDLLLCFLIIEFTFSSFLIISRLEFSVSLLFFLNMYVCIWLWHMGSF